MKRALVVALLILAAVPLLLAVSQLPPVGSMESPANTRVASRYLEHGPEEAGDVNIVTNIILNYRGFDTNGEVTVIFTALVAAFGILLATGKESTAAGTMTDGAGSLSVSPVVLFIVRTIAPFAVLFSIFMILHGHLTPGGGFQGGTILGALVIVLSLVLGRDRAGALLPLRARPWLQAAAVLAFTIVGAVGLATLGRYLEFPHDEAFGLVREVGLLVLEIGIGVGGAAIVASLFWAMEGDR